MSAKLWQKYYKFHFSLDNPQPLVAEGMTTSPIHWIFKQWKYLWTVEERIVQSMRLLITRGYRPVFIAPFLNLLHTVEQFTKFQKFLSFHESKQISKNKEPLHIPMILVTYAQCQIKGKCKTLLTTCVYCNNEPVCYHNDDHEPMGLYKELILCSIVTNRLLQIETLKAFISSNFS